jgi:hypothetical protein
LFKHSRNLIALALLGGLVGCTSGQSAVEPAVSGANLSLDKATLAVGVATFFNGTQGTNVVATFRQPNGNTATLVNTPSLTGPAAWLVPVAPASAPATGVDGGTNRITAAPQIQNGVTSPVPVSDTLAQTGGVFSYGFAPDNASTSGAIVTTSYSMPFWAAAGFTARSYKGGPPAYPQERNGLSGGGTAFIGFPQGFLTLNTAAVAGTYNLAINVTDSVGNSTNFAASAILTGTAGLPPYGAPTSVVEDGAGGLTVNFVAPAGVTETVVDIQDLNYCFATIGGAGLGSVWYSIVVQGSGAQSAVLPSTLGPTGSSAGACGSTSGPSILAGDTYGVFLVGADYPLFEAGPPQNVAQTPTLVGAAGQADITISARALFVY